jgi:hypothetical protein
MIIDRPCELVAFGTRRPGERAAKRESRDCGLACVGKTAGVAWWETRKQGQLVSVVVV